jgi:hypothetical protein
MIAYPGSFPCASRVEGHSSSASAGLVRTPMEAGNTRQRRAQRVLPHQLALVFVIDQDLYGAWLSWVNAHAWDEWVVMPLPGLRAGVAGTPTSPTPVRFMSDLQAELVPVHRLWVWRVSVAAEYLPLSSDFLALDGIWIRGGAPVQNFPDFVIGGTPAAPAPIFTNPGTPHAPVVII